MMARVGSKRGVIKALEDPGVLGLLGALRKNPENALWGEKQNRSWQYRVVTVKRVKSAAGFRAQRPGRGPFQRTLLALALLSGGLKAGPDQARPLLLGGGTTVSKIPVLLDPVLPVGALRPAGFPLLKDLRCSLARPVCVSEEAGTRALSLLESAYEKVAFGSDLGRLRATYQEPLVWQPSSVAALEVERDLLPSRGFDRGRAFCRGGAAHAETALLCVSEATLYSLAPAATSHLVSGLALSQQTLSPTRDAAGAASLTRPSAGVLTNSAGVTDFRTDALTGVSRSRSVRFFDYLEGRSVHGLGEASFLSLALAATRTEPGALRFDSEPDVMEVLFATHDGNRPDVARLFDDFAQQSVRSAATYGAEFEPTWTLSGDSLPRTVAFPDAIEPTGSVYLRLDLTEEQATAKFAFRMYCEAPVSYVWSVARLDERGEELKRVLVTFQETASSAETTVEPLPRTRALLLSGTNMGGVDVAHPFDPDHGPHEAHGCRAAVSVLPADAAKPRP